MESHLGIVQPQSGKNLLVQQSGFDRAVGFYKPAGELLGLQI